MAVIIVGEMAGAFFDMTVSVIKNVSGKTFLWHVRGVEKQQNRPALGLLTVALPNYMFVA